LGPRTQVGPLLVLASLGTRCAWFTTRGRQRVCPPLRATPRREWFTARGRQRVCPPLRATRAAGVVHGPGETACLPPAASHSGGGSGSRAGGDSLSAPRCEPLWRREWFTARGRQRVCPPLRATLAARVVHGPGETACLTSAASHSGGGTRCARDSLALGTRWRSGLAALGTRWRSGLASLARWRSGLAGARDSLRSGLAALVASRARRTLALVSTGPLAGEPPGVATRPVRVKGPCRFAPAPTP